MILETFILFIQRLYLAGLDGGYWGAMGVRAGKYHVCAEPQTSFATMAGTTFSSFDYSKNTMSYRVAFGKILRYPPTPELCCSDL